MKKWEYSILDLNTDDCNDVKVQMLDTHGEDGWEVIAVTMLDEYTEVWMKRPL